MEKINSSTVIVNTSDELKEILENDNNYDYIYLENDINIDFKITINPNKNKITIDGTYLNERHTYRETSTVDSTDIITACSTNYHIIVKNINIVNISRYGIIYVPLDINCCNVLTEYINVTFNGVEMIYNPYGKSKIIDCNITIERTLGVEAQEVCESDIIEIGGTTTISSTSSRFTLFYYVSDAPNPTLRFLPNSNVTLTSTNKELILGTNILFEILNDAVVNLTTANGFSTQSNQGATDILIDKRAIFNFTETSHRSIPMLPIFGNFTMNENSTLFLMNNYGSSPIDNYSLYFKGENQKITLNNPNIVIYNKMSNVIYSDNLVNFSFKVNDINMWNNSYDLSIAGSLSNLPDYSWYKDSLIEMEGTIENSKTIITKHNFTEEELNNLPSFSNFVFQDKQQLSIGTSKINIHPINSSSDKISGHTIPNALVKIEYNDISSIVSSDTNGYFELNALIPDLTVINFISNISGSFIYKRKTIETPHNGELTLMSAPSYLRFLLIQVSGFDNLFKRDSEMNIKIIDSRLNSGGFKLYASVVDNMRSNNFELKNSIVFRTFDGSILTLNENPLLVLEYSSNSILNEITYSVEKGILLDLNSNYLEINEEYQTYIIWNVS